MDCLSNKFWYRKGRTHEPDGWCVVDNCSEPKLWSRDRLLFNVSVLRIWLTVRSIEIAGEEWLVNV